MKYYDNNILDGAATFMADRMTSLGQFFSSEETLDVYSARINKIIHNSELYKKRQIFFKELIKNKVKRLFNEEERKNIDLRLDNGLASGIVDHCGILDNPILLGASLVSNYSKLFDRSTHGDILTFATGNIPVNEPFRRRGFMFRGRRINLYAKKDKNKIVYVMPKQDFNLVDRAVKAHEFHLYSKEEQSFLIKTTELIKKIDFSTCKSLGDQLTKINYYLWPFLFEEKLRSKLSNLISIEYDDIVSEYLIHIIENDKKSFIYMMLFDEKFREKTLKEFGGIVGAWNDEEDSGTHFFWGVDSNLERVSLRTEKDSLVSKDGNYTHLNEKDVILLLRQKKLIIGMLLKFSLVIFYMGLKPLAGLGSVEYLNRMKIKISNFLSKYFSDEVENFKNIDINGMVSIPLLLEKDGTNVKSINAFDVFYKGGISQDYFNRLSKLPLKSLVVPILTFYTYAAAKYGNEEDKKVKFELAPPLLNSYLTSLFD